MLAWTRWCDLCLGISSVLFTFRFLDISIGVGVSCKADVRNSKYHSSPLALGLLFVLVALWYPVTLPKRVRKGFGKDKNIKLLPVSYHCRELNTVHKRFYVQWKSILKFSGKRYCISWTNHLEALGSLSSFLTLQKVVEINNNHFPGYLNTRNISFDWK